MYIPRIIDIFDKSKNNSVLLIGPRQTGKSSLLQSCLPKGTPQFFACRSPTIYRQDDGLRESLKEIDRDAGCLSPFFQDEKDHTDQYLSEIQRHSGSGE